MLTDSELAWVKDRKEVPMTCFCNHCQYFGTFCGKADFISAKCPTSMRLEDVLEAAEFEARVAARIAKAFKDYVKSRNCVDFDLMTKCPGWEICAPKRPHPPCDFAILKGVRIAVEEEIDAKG